MLYQMIVFSALCIVVAFSMDERWGHLAGEEDRCRLEEFAAHPQHLVHLTAGHP